jgi:hypothetical protein
VAGIARWCARHAVVVFALARSRPALTREISVSTDQSQSPQPRAWAAMILSLTTLPNGSGTRASAAICRMRRTSFEPTPSSVDPKTSSKLPSPILSRYLGNAECWNNSFEPEATQRAGGEIDHTLCLRFLIRPANPTRPLPKRVSVPGSDTGAPTPSLMRSYVTGAEAPPRTLADPQAACKLHHCWLLFRAQGLARNCCTAT